MGGQQQLTFDPVLSLDNTSNGFRVLTNHDSQFLTDTSQLTWCPCVPVILDHITVHCSSKKTLHDGILITGSSYVMSQTDPRNKLLHLLDDPDPNHDSSIVYAIYHSLQILPPTTLISFHVDSMHALKILLKQWWHWDNTAYLNTPNAPLTHACVFHLCNRTATIMFQCATLNSDLQLARDLATAGTQKLWIQHLPHYPIIASTHLRGIKLAILTQKLTYWALRHLKLEEAPMRTTRIQTVALV